MLRYVKQHSLIIINNDGKYQCIQGLEILEVDLFHIYIKISIFLNFPFEEDCALNIFVYMFWDNSDTPLTSCS